MPSKKKIYCSLDIESTGLDAEKDHIIEVGAVLFEVEKGGEIKFGKEFSELVKPPIEIPVFIQNLTNIKQSDVENSQTWEKILPRFKKFVGTYPIVGQNVHFDLKFLMSRGLQFKNPVIDTQTLARVFAPHSKYFNLDYLHTHFGLQIESHHRALADAKSASIILGKIVNSFQSLPLAVQKQIIKLLQTSSLTYKGLFALGNSDFSHKKISAGNKKEKIPVQAQLFEEIESGVTAKLPEKIDFKEILTAKGVNFFALPASAMKIQTLEALSLEISQSSDNVLLAIPYKSDLDKFKELSHWLVLSPPENYFCETKLAEVMRYSKLPDEFIEFLIKVLVWKENGGKNFSDLPMFTVEQMYKKLICGNLTTCAEHKKNEICSFAEINFQISKSNNLVFLHQSLPAYKEILSKEKFKSFFWDAGALLTNLEKETAKVITLKRVSGVLRLLANSDNNKGLLADNKSIKQKVVKLMNQIDLDFGLLGIELSQEPFAVGTRMVDDELRESYSFVKMEQVFTKFSKALSEIVKEAEAINEKKSVEETVITLLSDFADFFTEFFLKPIKDHLYWFDTYGGEIKLGKRPRVISLGSFLEGSTNNFFAPFSTPEVTMHIQEQLGLKSVNAKPGDFPAVNAEIILPEENRQAVTDAKLVECVKRAESRTLVLFNSQRALDSAYAHLEKNKLNKNLLVQRHTGHHWKNEEAYNKNDKAIWFLTVHNFLKLIRALPATANLIMPKIPYAVSDSASAKFDQDEVFEKFVVPRTVLRLEKISSLFLNLVKTTHSQKFFLLDGRINADYNQPIYNALTVCFGGDVQRFFDADSLAEKIST